MDLVGFTTLAEHRDAEDVRELLSRYFDLARSVVERYGGVVEKFIGDAIMAVWGVPVANEDDAERAVRTALDLVAAVGALGAELSTPSLSARAGIVSGEAAANLGAVGQGIVAGDIVNTASRLQSVAAGGQVLVGEATYLAARDAIAFESAGQLELKGKGERVAAWRALRVVGRRKGIGRSEGAEAPFVGRDEELRLLSELLHATGRERKARMVSVTGVAGIGKSRLAWELLKYVDGLAETVYWHHGRSPSYGEGVTFWALAEMVRMRAGITEGEDPVPARKKLSACTAEFVPDAEERSWLEPRLLHLIGLAEAPPGDRQELFSAWRTFFERIGDRGPVVLVFEDLQWADTGLLDYVESVVEWSRNQPIFVLTLARPELADRRPTWASTIRNFTSLHLEPLPQVAMRRLLLGLVPGLPPDAADRLVARAEGVPLYAVETVRALVDRGVLALSRSADCYELVAEIGDVDTPDTLHALVASRLDSLPAEERALLQDAAVLGKTFNLAALSLLSGTPEDLLSQRLRDLARREIVGLDADPRSPERGQYGFLQALMLEVAHGTLSRQDRRAKHLAAAHIFEAMGDEELAGVVASHYLEAHGASQRGPEAEAVAARARDWLGLACARARSLGATEEALAYAEQALNIAWPGPERAALLELAGKTAFEASEHERALAHLEEAAMFYEQNGDPIGSGRATALLAETLGVGLERYGVAIQRGERAFAALEETGESGPAAAAALEELASVLSRNCTLAGAAETGLAWAERALAYAEQLDDRGPLARALGARAMALFNLGRHREATVLATGVVELAVSAGPLREQAMAKLSESVYVSHDDPQRGLRAAMEASTLARRAGDRGLEVVNLLNAAEGALYMGDWAVAREALQEVADKRVSKPLQLWRGACEAVLSGVTGAPETALEVLSRAAEMGASEFVASRTTYLRFKALLNLAAGALDSAFADAAAAVAADPSGINSAVALAIEAHAALWRRDSAGAAEALEGMQRFRGRWTAAARATTEAGLAALAAQVEEATSKYRAAGEAWRALGTPLDLALCGIDAARALPPPDHPHELIAEAREVLALIGAAPFLTLLDKAVLEPVGMAELTPRKH